MTLLKKKKKKTHTKSVNFQSQHDAAEGNSINTGSSPPVDSPGVQMCFQSIYFDGSCFQNGQRKGILYKKKNTQLQPLIKHTCKTSAQL